MGRNLSGHSNKVTKRREFTAWRRQREGHVRVSKRVTENGALTNWRQRTEGVVRTQTGSELSSGTHVLERTDRRICQGEIRRACEGTHLLGSTDGTPGQDT